MDPMCLSLVQQFLDVTNSSLAYKFRHKYETRKTNVKYEEVLLKWRVDELTQSLVHEYLKTVSPALANKFKVKYQPDKTKLQLTEVLFKWKEEQLAKGLVFNHLKTVAPSLAVEFENATGMKSGKYSAEEVTRVRLAVKNNEDYKVVAKELNRAPELVRQHIYYIANDPNNGTGQARKSFSVEEDLMILDEVISGMDVTKLSCMGTFSTSIAAKVAKEIARPLRSI